MTDQLAVEAAEWLKDHNEVEGAAKHARLSPSSATGWMNCPDYPNVNARYPDEDNEAAAEGTAAHAISDFCLTHGFDAFDMSGTVTNIHGKVLETYIDDKGRQVKTGRLIDKTFRFTWTEDDAELLQPGLDWVREQPGQFFGEARVDLSEWLGAGQFGTMDRAILSENQLVVSDLKWGRGIPVQAVGNKQLRIYALGAWRAYASHITDPSFPIIINIDQPRNAAGGGIWKITLGELLAFGDEVRAAAARTHEKNPPRIPTPDGCLWCKGKDDCDAYHEYALELLGIDDFEDLDDLDELVLPDVSKFTPQRRRVILEHTTLIKKWLDSVHTSLYSAVTNGGDSAGLKLVEGRKSPDKWKDAKAAEKALETLGDKRFTKKLITPTQAGKAIKGDAWTEIYAEHVNVGKRKPTLVDESDERPAIEAFTDASEFDDLDDD